MDMDMRPAMTDSSIWRCHVCGSSNRKVLAELTGKDGQSYRAVRCRACGLLSSDPIPRLDPETLQRIYSQTYYETGWCDGGEGYEDPAKVASMEKEARDQLEAIERKTGLSRGAVLDVGCSDGRYLKAVQDAGWRVAGVEVSRYSAEQAQRRLGVEIHTSPIELLDLQDSQFDLVRMKHCIEHLADPRSALKQVARLLKPGGYAVIDTDNADGLRSAVENGIRGLLGRGLARGAVKALTGKNLDTRYGRLSPPIHLYTFSLSTLTRLLDECGLEVVESLRPAQGHPIWFPQLHRYRCNPLEAMFRLIDDVGGWFQRGEALVVFARKR
jgi:SAM-dependent methyltransferase/DNA-directed RNA polymerase subunit RPC12/RpoP